MENGSRTHSPLVRLVICLLVLSAGVAGFVALKKLKKPPPERPPAETALPVEVMEVRPGQYPVTLTGYGELTSRRIVTLSAEVRGRIIREHDRLLPGLLVKKGELLFAIDSEEYQLAYDSATALLKILDRDLVIARAEFKRVKKLYEKNRVGTLSAVEKAESSVNSIRDRIEQVRRSREDARIQLSRCTLRAPFAGRVTEVMVDAGEYVTAGTRMVTLIDDAALEVIVPLDGRDAVHWLQVEKEAKSGPENWFARPVPVPCRITWSDDSSVQADGRMDRIVSMDTATRMVKVAISLVGQQDGSVPLVAGMFCRVAIPGRLLRDVYVVPRQAVTFDGRVYVVEKGRLHSRKVHVVREEGPNAVITAGLSPGQKVITTRLVEPLENSLVRVIDHDGENGGHGMKTTGTADTARADTKTP
jgi:RND family efflux transporter MFP subunit